MLSSLLSMLASGPVVALLAAGVGALVVYLLGKLSSPAAAELEAEKVVDLALMVVRDLKAVEPAAVEAPLEQGLQALSDYLKSHPAAK